MMTNEIVVTNGNVAFVEEGVRVTLPKDFIYMEIREWVTDRFYDQLVKMAREYAEAEGLNFDDIRGEIEDDLSEMAHDLWDDNEVEVGENEFVPVGATYPRIDLFNIDFDVEAVKDLVDEHKGKYYRITIEYRQYTDVYVKASSMDEATEKVANLPCYRIQECVENCVNDSDFDAYDWEECDEYDVDPENFIED